jgi:GntR family transcriptional regulator, rspAB operon transcriptional repressor
MYDIFTMEDLMESAFKLNEISDRQLLKDRVYDTIKNNIIDLHLYPGEQLTEQRLSDELRVSKSPVRDAIHRLEQQGLICVIPYKGCYVAGLEKQECRELFQLREALEIFSIEQRIDSYTEKDIAEFCALMTVAVDEINKGNESSAYNTHLSFHRLIVDKLGNRLIENIYTNVQDRMKRYLNFVVKYSPNRVKLSSEQHVVLLDAIRQKDKARASRELKHHLATVLQDFLTCEQMMEGNGGGIEKAQQYASLK